MWVFQWNHCTDWLLQKYVKCQLSNKNTWLHFIFTVLFHVDQVGFALTLDRTKKQWVDFGIQTEVCMTLPQTCDAAGGVISLWIKIVDCPDRAGIISSHTYGKTSSRIVCTSNNIRYDIDIYVPFFKKGVQNMLRNK